MADSSFVRAIEDNPGDDELRLLYADWLEERGDHRAEYIRLKQQFEMEKSRLEEMDCQLREHEKMISSDWLDSVFPLVIRSPMVGTLYLFVRPDRPPYVNIGHRVDPNTVVAALKVFNEIHAGLSGYISKVLVKMRIRLNTISLCFRFGAHTRIGEHRNCRDLSSALRLC